MSGVGFLSSQVVSFLWALAIGVALGVLYDCFRIVRLAFPSPSPVVIIQDILFGLLAAMVSFIYLLSIIDGKLRIFLLIGEGVGWTLYYFTVGDIVMAFSSAIIDFIRRILSALLRLLLAVYGFVYRLIIAPILWIGNHLFGGAKRAASGARRRAVHTKGNLTAKWKQTRWVKTVNNLKKRLQNGVKSKLSLQRKP